MSCSLSQPPDLTHAFAAPASQIPPAPSDQTDHFLAESLRAESICTVTAFVMALSHSPFSSSPSLPRPKRQGPARAVSCAVAFGFLRVQAFRVIARRQGREAQMMATFTSSDESHAAAALLLLTSLAVAIT